LERANRSLAIMTENPNEQSDPKNSENSESEKSDEFLKFEEAMKKIFSLSPDEAKKIREKYPDPEGETDETDS
jgi:hypothetical protein